MTRTARETTWQSGLSFLSLPRRSACSYSFNITISPELVLRLQSYPGYNKSSCQPTSPCQRKSPCMSSLLSLSASWKTPQSRKVKAEQVLRWTGHELAWDSTCLRASPLSDCRPVIRTLYPTFWIVKSKPMYERGLVPVALHATQR